MESFVENINFNRKKNLYNLNVDGTKNNKIFILLRYKDVLNNQKLSFLRGQEMWLIVKQMNIRKKGYVLLATVQVEPILRKNENMLTREDILVTNRFLRNQTQTTKKDYHFGTTGHIYMGLAMVLFVHPTQKHNKLWISLQKNKLF